jgi:hypothetical protein
MIQAKNFSLTQFHIRINSMAFPEKFKDDVSDYSLMRRVYFSHSNSTEDKFASQHDDDGDSDINKSTKPIRLSHLIAFNVKENDNVISGILTIEFEYYSSDGSIKYRDMRYSDPRLIKHIEGNPRVMKNIDSYLRKNLLEAEYGLKLMS